MIHHINGWFAENYGLNKLAKELIMMHSPGPDGANLSRITVFDRISLHDLVLSCIVGILPYLTYLASLDDPAGD